MIGRWLALATAASTLAGMIGAASAQDAETVLQARCAACHERTAEGGLNRISEVRKTPEGWDMTIVRMMIMHGVEVTPYASATPWSNIWPTPRAWHHPRPRVSATSSSVSPG